MNVRLIFFRFADAKVHTLSDKKLSLCPETDKTGSEMQKKEIEISRERLITTPEKFHFSSFNFHFTMISSVKIQAGLPVARCHVGIVANGTACTRT